MTPDQVPAELADRLARMLHTAEWVADDPREMPPKQQKHWDNYSQCMRDAYTLTARQMLAGMLPAAYDMWRETAINDAARILFHTDRSGLKVTCQPCGQVLFTGCGSVGVSHVLAAVLGHLASEQHTNPTTKENHA